MDTRFKEIQQTVLDAKAQATELNALDVLTVEEQTLSNATSTSKVANWRLWVWIISFAIWVHEKFVSQNAENSRPHTIRWYQEQAYSFIDGCPLIWENGQFYFDTNGLTAEEIAQRKIIARCAVLESNDGELVFKIGKNNAGSIEPLSPAELIRFTKFLNDIKDAGNILRIINEVADLLKLTITAYVDVEMIDLDNGKQLNVSGDVYPVVDAVNSYLENLEFNGAFVREFLRGKIQAADGVKLVTLVDAQWKYAAFPFDTIGEWKVPEAGYFKINPGDLAITYLNSNELV